MQTHKSEEIVFLFRFDRPPGSTLFPYTTLFRSLALRLRALGRGRRGGRRRLPRRAVRARARRRARRADGAEPRSEEHTSELQSRRELVCRLLLEKKNSQPPISISW